MLPDKNEYAHLYLAVAYQGLGDQSNACKHYNEVLKINPNNQTARDNRKSLGC
jgi:Tfp pilus assembly protein PilF